MTRAEFERLLDEFGCAVMVATEIRGTAKFQSHRMKDARAAVLAAFDEAMRGNDGK